MEVGQVQWWGLWHGSIPTRVCNWTGRRVDAERFTHQMIWSVDTRWRLNECDHSISLIWMFLGTGAADVQDNQSRNANQSYETRKACFNPSTWWSGLIQGTVVEAFNSILALRPMDVSKMAVGCLAKGAQAYAKQRYGIAVRMRLLTCWLQVLTATSTVSMQPLQTVKHKRTNLLPVLEPKVGWIQNERKSCKTVLQHGRAIYYTWG